MIDLYQRILSEWCERAFGKQIATSRTERAIRVLEEAIEFCQSAGVEDKRMYRLMEVVLTRPANVHPWQEAAQVLVATLVALDTWGFTAEEQLREETMRILNKDLSKFRARMQEKLDAGVGGDPTLELPKS